MKNMRIEHPGLNAEAVKDQVQSSNLQTNKPSVGVALKAALEKR